jgi:hypothetical protein
VHKYMRTHGNEGATEPGRVRPPFSCTRRTLNPKFVEVLPFARQGAIRIERPSTS